MAIEFKRNYKHFLLGAFLILSLVILGRLFSDLSFPNKDTDVSRNEKAILFPNNPVTQLFAANQNNLKQVNIALKNTQKNISDKILIELEDKKCEKIIARDKISYFTYLPKGYYKLKFSQISDSENKIYCLKVTNMGKQEKKSEMPYIIVSNDPKFSNSSYINSGKGTEMKGESLIFEPAYSEGSFSKDIEMLVKRMSQYKPWFFKNWYLSAIFISFLLITFVLVFILALN